MLMPSSRPAKLQYLMSSFRVLVDGDHVTCAVSGKRIPIDELRYWSASRQEAYCDAETATEAMTRA